MATSANQRQLSTIIGLGVGTVFLATLQTLSFVAVVRDATEALQIQASIFLPTSLILTVPYLLIPTIGCSILSLLFRPKRLISPLYVLTLTISIVTLMVTYRVATTDLAIPSIANQVFQNLVVTVIFSYLFAIAFGVLALRFVRWFVGLSEENVDRLSFFVNQTPEKVMEILGESLRDSHHFKIRKIEERCWVLKKIDEWNNATTMVIGPDQNDQNKSQISTVAFFVGQYTIKKTKQSTDTRDSIINDLKIRLARVNSNLEFSSNGEIENGISKIAYDEAKKITLSKIEITQEVFRRIPKPYRTILYIIIGAYVLLTLAFAGHVGNFDFNTYVILSATFILAIVVDIGIPLTERLSRRRRPYNEF